MLTPTGQPDRRDYCGFDRAGKSGCAGLEAVSSEMVPEVGWRMRAIKWLLLMGVLAGLLFAGRYWFRTTIHVSWGYDVEARFSELPAGDQALGEWLKTRSGVLPNTVSIRREGLDSKLLKISFMQSRNLTGEPPFPDLEGACERLGYGQPDGAFRDSAQRP